jgi:hypothetical protein
LQIRKNANGVGRDLTKEPDQLKSTDQMGDELLSRKPPWDCHIAVELFDLTGKRALVTGSLQGIGFGRVHY